MFNNAATGNLQLFTIYDNNPKGYMPLVIWNPIPVPIENSEILQCYISSSYTGVPNSSSVMPLNIVTIPYLDYGQPMPLNINNDGKASSGNIDLRIYTSDSNNIGVFGTNQLYLDSTGNYTASQYNSVMPLYMERPIAEALPLFVYNTIVESGINLFISGVPVFGSGLNLVFGSGSHSPNKSTILFTRGTTLI